MSPSIEESLQAKRQWVAEQRSAGVEGIFKAQAIALPLPPSFHDAVRAPRAEHAIIGGVKRRCPRSGASYDVDLAAMVRVMEERGVSAVALTPDEDLYGGCFADLLVVAQTTSVPILCSDLVIDPLQIVMARCHGAAAVTVDASVVNDRELKALFRQSVELGLDLVFVARSASDLDRISRVRVGSAESGGPRIVGIDARDTATGELDLALCERLWPAIPEHVAPIVAAGACTRADVLTLEAIGFEAFVVCDPLMETDRLDEVVHQFAGEPVAAASSSQIPLAEIELERS